LNSLSMLRLFSVVLRGRGRQEHDERRHGAGAPNLDVILGGALPRIG